MRDYRALRQRLEEAAYAAAAKRGGATGANSHAHAPVEHPAVAGGAGAGAQGRGGSRSGGGAEQEYPGMPVAAASGGHEAGREEREREVTKAGAEDEFVTREDEFATPDKRKAPAKPLATAQGGTSSASETLGDAPDEARELTVPPTFAGAAAVATAAV